MSERRPESVAAEDIPEARPGSDHAETAGGTLDRSLDLIRFLRANCPWDAAQTHESLVPYLLEESHEVAEAIHAGDMRGLEGELGDLLLNLAFQIVVGEEQNSLTAESVTHRIEEKMRRRHPHLYGLGPKESWEAIKARERALEGDGDTENQAEPGGVLDGVPETLDALGKAYRIQDRVAGVGFDWEDHRGAFDKVTEELEEVGAELDERPTPAKGTGPMGADLDGTAHAALEEELGDLLFAVVNLVRLAGSHPVRALSSANRKFTRRFEGVERLARERGVVLGEASLEELDKLWDAVKVEERAE